MKPKYTDEEKKELLRICIEKLNYCNRLLEKAFIHHTIASKKAAANDKK